MYMGSTCGYMYMYIIKLYMCQSTIAGYTLFTCVAVITGGLRTAYR